jgi:hypothetical protein
MLALFGFLLLGISPQEEIEFNCAPGGCHHDEGGHNGHKDTSDVPSKNHDAPDIPDVPDKAEWPFAAPVGRAQVLVIVSDHGSGTTDFGEALNTHPCMFDLGEPFANANVLWATSSEDAAACDSDSAQGSRQPDSIFDATTKSILQKYNPQLTLKIQALQFKPRGMRPSPELVDENKSIYKDLDYDISEYFVRIRDYVCASVPAEVCAPSNCTITLKMFPQFVNGNTNSVAQKTKCTIARNNNAMIAWQDALATFEQNPKVATFKLSRFERDRQFSIFRRFTPDGTEFDCSLPRPPSTFATMATLRTERQLQIEDCWKDAEGAAKCLRDALQLVGLSPELMGTNGTQVMAGEINDGDVHVESASCNTDPYATFRHIVVDEHDSVNKVADSDVHPDRQWSDFPEIETAPYSELLLRRILQRREVGVTPVANLASSAPLSSAAAPSPSPE